MITPGRRTVSTKTMRAVLVVAAVTSCGDAPVRLTKNAMLEGTKLAWSPDGSKIAS